MRLMPLLILSMISVAMYFANALQREVRPQAQTVSTNVSATEFLNYRSAVMAYMTANPGHTGTITSSQLATVSGLQFSSSFLSSTGNAETASGSGVEVTVYSYLPTGTLQTVLNQSGGDVSIGISSGSTWTTMAAGVVATPQPLTVSIPAGDVVSVFVMGT